MRLFRIADGRYPVWEGRGAAFMGGRFNSPGHPVIYAATTFAGAMLEVLAHARIGKLPHTHVFVSADVPEDVLIERADKTCLPVGWDAPDSGSARAFGDRWMAEARTAVLLVPSIVAQEEWNALVNPQHPLAARIRVSDPLPVVWDARLFSRA